MEKSRRRRAAKPDNSSAIQGGRTAIPALQARSTAARPDPDWDARNAAIPMAAIAIPMAAIAIPMAAIAIPMAPMCAGDEAGLNAALASL